jgi:hypothetical protein
VTVLFLLSCREPSRIDAPSAFTRGQLAGTVTLLGDVSPPKSNARVSLYSSMSDFETGHAARVGEATPSAGTPRTFSFRVDEIVPGAYYIRACFAFGCGEYRDDIGALSPVSIRAGRTTMLALRF